MSKMDVIGELRKRERERNKGEEEITQARPGFTLAEIKQDKEKSILFGKFLEKSGQIDLAIRFNGNKPELDDDKLLDQYRATFDQRMLEMEEAEAMLSPESIKEFADNHPDFQIIVNLAGPEKATKVIKAQLRKMSIDEPSRFYSIASKLEKVKEFKDGKYRVLNEKILRFCKHNNVDPKQVVEALDIENEDERERELQKLVGFKTTGWNTSRRLANFFSFADQRLEELKSLAKDVEKAKEALNTLQENVGDVLALSVNDKQTSLQSLFSEILGKKEPKAKESGWGEAEKESEIDEKSLAADWQVFKDSSSPDFPFDSLDFEEREYHKYLFLEQQKEKHKNKETEKSVGFWDYVFSVMFETNLKNKVNNLK